MAAWKVIIVLGLLGFCDCQRKQGRNIAVGSEGKTPANFDCPEEFGYYPHPTDCTQYYVCVFGGALLESCTGGLMYSHELQTCDWPRNVGCDGLHGVPISSPGGDVRVSVTPARSPVPERVRYTVVPTAQPQPVVSSRGQSRQLHATVHERVHERERVQDILSKQQQQQQLYADADDVLPPAEQIENDRQQRVYRGQPSTVGQVQRDRDGLRHTNAIPSSSRAEKIGVISFGTAQQQPVQQYRNHSLYIDNSLTDDSTVKHRLKRHTRRRLAPIDLVATGDSSISWSRPAPVPVAYQPQVQQKVYHNHRPNAMELQPLRYNKQEYSAILPGGGQTEFQPFAPNQYKQPVQYIVPKPKPVVYQYFKQNPQPHQQYQGDNYAYFNLGGLSTSPTVMYASSNQQHQTYYRPQEPPQQAHQQQQQQQQFQKPQQPVQYQQQYKPFVNTASHVQYNHKPVPEVEQSSPHPIRQPLPANHKEEPEKEEEEKEEEEEEEENPDEKQEQSEDIKPEFPSPPPFFFKSTNKYEDIENPFADPNFDFDKFISKIKGFQENDHTQESKSLTTENDSTEKDIQKPNIELKTPVAFSTTKKKVTPKPVSEEDYYYDDTEEEQEEEKLKRPYTKQEEEPRIPYQKHQEEELPQKSYHKHEEVQRLPYQNPEQELPRRPYQNHEQELSQRPYQKHEETQKRPNPQTEEVEIPRRPQIKKHEEEQRIPYRKHQEEELPRKSYQKHEEIQKPLYQKPEQELPRRPYQNNEQELPQRPYRKHEEVQNRPYPQAEDELPSRSPLKKLEEEQRRPYQHPKEESSRRPYQTHEEISHIHQKKENVPIKIISTTKRYPINKNPSSHPQINVYDRKTQLSPVTLQTQNKKHKSPKINEEKPRPNLKNDEEYQYYDDEYDYEEEEQIKKPVPQHTTIKSVTKPIIKQPPKITNPSVITYKNRPNYEATPKTQNLPVTKPIKYVEKTKENKPSITKHITSSSPQTTESTHKITTIKFPKLQTRPLTTTLRSTKDFTTRKTNKDSSRLEESANTQSHSIGSQSTPSGRTLYNGSQHYDPQQYDPYYTLYEDDVELYRDVDYTPQQQYTSNRAQPQQVYRGTPAPIAVPVQSTVQEETVPQRNSAYYSTQAQDVYSAAQDYVEDNYNTQVDDTASYRQPSRQPSRGDRNELSYYVESTPKSTTTIRTTTTTTTTTPRPIPVKQSVVPTRSSIITANQTRPQSIIITLSATPGQNSSSPTSNKTDIDSFSSRFVSLSTGFNLRHKDSEDPTPVTYKPHLSDRPAPFSLTKLPDNETKSIVFRLSSRLIALSPNVSDESTETPSKREVVDDAHVKTTDSSHVVPTTYSPSKTVLASILQKDNITESKTENEERLVSVLPRKVIIVNQKPLESQRKSVTIENPERNADKPVKTIVRKLPVKTESTTPISFVEKNKERKIISKIHFGIPQTYTASPDKINNLASTASTSNFQNAEESSRRPVNAHYITTDLTSTYKPAKFTSTTETIIVQSTEDVSEEISTPRSRFRFAFSPKTTAGTTERGNIVKYTPNIFDTEYIDSIEHSTTHKPHSRFNFNYNIHPTSERTRYSTIETLPEYVEESSTTERNKFSFNSESNPSAQRSNNVRYTSSTTEITHENIKQISSTERSKNLFYTNSNSSTERPNFVRYSPSTTEASTENFNKISTTERSKYLFNSNSNPTNQRTNFVRYTPTTAQTSTENIEVSTQRTNLYKYPSSIIDTNTENVEEISSNERTKYLLNSNPSIQHSRYIPSTTETTENNEQISSTEHTKFFNSNPATQRSSFARYIPNNTEISTENLEKLSSTERIKYLFNSNLNPSTQRTNFVKYTPSTTETSTENLEQMSSTERTKHIFNSNSNTQRTNFARYTSSTTEQENLEQASSTEKSKFLVNSNLDTNTQRTNYNRYASSTTEKGSTENIRTDEISNERVQNKFGFNSERKIVAKFLPSTEKYVDSSSSELSTEKPNRFSFNPTTERKYYKFTPSAASGTEFKSEDLKIVLNPSSENDSNEKNSTYNKNYFNNKKPSSIEYEDSAENISGERSKFSSTERDSYYKYSSTTEFTQQNGNQRSFNKVVFNSNSGSSTENVKYSTNTTEKQYGTSNSNTATVHKPIFRFVYNPGPTTSTERFSSTENDSAEKFRPNTSTSKTIITTTDHTTTTTKPSTTILSVESKDYVSDEATEKYKFVQSSSEISDTNDNIRSQLFVNRNAKPFRATAEIPPVSEILAMQDEPRKKEIDNPPTYKPKPFDANANANRNASRNVTLPVRLSRVNTAIKSLTAFGGSRRNSQTPKCNENQTTPDTKCNEIQKQRTSTRGRGSAHYTNAGAGDNLAVNVNRGTPATPRSRPTLKPSTSIVSKASEYVDIYRYPPLRPDAIYPQPQVDKTAAKCRKDVCLLPDCYCGGKDIPGDLPVEQVPQIVLLTFDDSVNDLNKGLYSDLFEKGRTNPNGCPIAATFYVSHEWTDYSQVQNLYSDGHELASHTVSHSFGEQFSQKKWNREVAGQREILAAYGGVHLEDVRGMRAPFLSVGGNKMFKMLYDSNFTYDSSLPVYENRPPSWPYTLDYKLFHDCMIPPCPTRSYPGVWEVPMVMWQDLNGGRCSMGDACSNPPDADGVYKMLMKNFERHYTTNRAPFGLFYHAAWFTQPHHKEGFIKFLDFLVSKDDVYLTTNWQAIQWVRDPTPLNRIKNFPAFQCNFQDRPKRCNNPKVCNLWHKSGVRYMKTCQPCPDIYPWTGKTGIRSSRIDNDIED